MSSKVKPTELELLVVTPELKRVLPVTKTGQIFDNSSQFHPEGLFSVEHYGMVGSEERSTSYTRIELNMTLLHPLIFKTICELGALYKRVMEGNEYVIFDNKTKDLIPSMSPSAKTGYSFFLSVLPNIVFKQTTSKKRGFKIQLVEKALKENKAFMDNLLVLPAGLRDYTIGRDGRPEEDEINTHYRKIISITNLVDPIRYKKNPDLFDESAIGAQRAIHTLYEYIMSLMDGKHKLLAGKWVSRKIFNTTSNVASSYTNKTNGINDPRRLGYNDTMVGLYQFARSSAPLSIYNIKNKYIKEIFPDGASVVQLTNTKTLKKENVVVSGIQKEINLWTTTDGLEKIIASLGNPDVVDDEIIFSTGKHGHYMGLLYRDDKYFKFFQDIDEVPNHLDRSKVKPITLFEFIYISLYSMSGKYPGYVTRYPILGAGSIYPSWVILTTTTKTESLRELDWEWQPQNDDDHLAINFPIASSGYMRTIVVHPSHLGPLGGDFDGDMLHLKMVLSNEAIDEVRKFLNSKEYYINDQGRMIFSSSTEVLNSVLKFMSF